MVKITGTSEFWHRSHPLSDANSKLYSQIVPPVGAAPTTDGELLRCINKVVYEVFNNGLSNDIDYELEFLLEHFDLYSPFLTDKRNISALINLRDFYPETLKLDWKWCGKLDTICSAIVQYCQSKQAA